MFSWEQRKLGEIGKWYKGIGGTKDDLNTKQSGRMFVHYADLYQTSEFLSNVVHWTINEIIGALIAPNSILFPMSDVTPYGLARTTSCKLKDVRAGGDVLINTIDTNIDSDFVSIYINLFSKNILPFVTGTTVKHINSKSLSELTILIPSFEEQVKIVNLVKFYNEIITLHQCKLEKLKLTKKALLQKLFPKNGKHIPEIRFKGFTDAWEQHKLGECMDSFEYGLNAAAKEYDGMHKYIRITDIDDETHNFIQSNLTSPDIDFNSDVSDYKLNINDIVFARTGASVGKTYLYNPSDGDLYYAGFLIRGKVNEACDAGFIYQNTLTRDYDSFIRITSQRSGQPGVNSKEYATFRLNIPCKDEQEKISELLNRLDKLFTLHQRKLERLQEVKKGLLQKMFV